VSASRLARPLAAAALACLLAVLACGREDGGEAAGAGGAPESAALSVGEAYLVRVGGTELDGAAFDAMIPEEFRGLLTAREKRNYLDRWVDTELIYRAAESRGLLEDPELRARLREQRREFIASQLLQRVLDERVAVTESEIADYYAEHLDEYSSEYRYREIVVRSQQEAEDLHARLLGNAVSFARAAERNSISSSARLGGDMGWLAKGAMPPEVEERIVRMKPQEISQPFETAWGWTLVQYRDKRRAEDALSLQEVKDEILRVLTMERRRRVYEEFLDELRRSYPVTYHPQLDERLRAEEYAPAGR